MKWRKLSAGSCGARADIVGVDPNLVWADATHFADFRRGGASHPDPFPVLVELHEDDPASTVSALERLHDELVRHGGGVPAVYPRTVYPAVRYCTAWFSSAYCHAVLNDPHHRLGTMIKRFVLQMPVVPSRPRPVRKLAAPASGSRRARASRVLVGVIDSGCPFAHLDLRDVTGQGTRILNIWDQNADPAFTRPACGGVRPVDMGYGCEVSRGELNALMKRHLIGGTIDEDACYAEADEPLLRERYAHGAAVLGLLVGRHYFGQRTQLDASVSPNWVPLEDAGSTADVVFVQTPRDHAQDSSSASLERYVLDGLRYIVSCVGDDTERIVVNISDGSMRGSHDGRSIIELAFAELVDEQAALGRSLNIVLAAGNAYEDRRHAQIDVPTAAGPWERSVTLQLPHGNETPAYLFVRVPAGAHAPSVSLRAASLAGQAPQWVTPGEAWGLDGVASAPVAGVLYPQRTPADSSLVMVAFRPTALDASVAGRWEVRIKASHPLDEALHLYIALGQRNAGALPRTQQPRFVDIDGSYDPTRPLRRSGQDPDPPVSVIRRRGTLSSLTTAAPRRGIHVVGSAMWRPRSESPYSAAGPAAGQGGRDKVDLSFCTDFSPALMGLSSMGVRSGETVRVSGTSFAAPQFARLLANDVPGGAVAPSMGIRRYLAHLKAVLRPKPGTKLLAALYQLYSRRLTSGPGASPR